MFGLTKKERDAAQHFQLYCRTLTLALIQRYQKEQDGERDLDTSPEIARRAFDDAARFLNMYKALRDNDHKAFAAFG